MTINANETSNSTIFTNHCTACNDTASSHCCIFTNSDIMSNLNLIIENHTIFNNGIFKRTSIDSCTRANFNMIANNNAAKLRDFMPFILPTNRSITKTIRANDSISLNQTCFSNNNVMINANI